MKGTSPISDLEWDLQRMLDLAKLLYRLRDVLCAGALSCMTGTRHGRVDIALYHILSLNGPRSRLTQHRFINLDIRTSNTHNTIFSMSHLNIARFIQRRILEGRVQRCNSP